MKMKLLYPVLGALAATMGACSVPSGWSVDGVIAGADSGTRLALEK